MSLKTWMGKDDFSWEERRVGCVLFAGRGDGKGSYHEGHFSMNKEQRDSAGARHAAPR